MAKAKAAICNRNYPDHREPSAKKGDYEYTVHSYKRRAPRRK